MADERDITPGPERRRRDDDRPPGRPKPKPRPDLPGCKITFSPWIAHTDNAAFGIEAQHLYWLSDQVGNFDCGEQNCRLIGYHFMEDIDRVTPDDAQTRAGHKYLL